MQNYNGMGTTPWYDSRSSITSVVINDGVTSIGNFAIAFFDALNSVSIAGSVSHIGVDAFYSCSALTSLTLPDGLTTIGVYAFNRCSALTDFIVNEANANFSAMGGVLFNKNQTTLVRCPEGKTGTYTIPSGVTAIGDNAFQRCSTLTSVVIPNGITSIGGSAFMYCIGLASVDIPQSVTTINNSAFEQCSSLASVTLRQGLQTIGDYAFFGTSLTAITLPSGLQEIGSSAFRNTGLTAITIPDGVTAIGDYAFMGGGEWESGLSGDLYIPASVSSIGIGIAQLCWQLHNIYVAPESPYFTDIDGVLLNKERTIIYQQPLGRHGRPMIIPDGVVEIKQEAMVGRGDITTLTIPRSVSIIGDNAFNGAAALQSVICLNPDTVHIGEFVFGSNADPYAYRQCTLYVPAGSGAKYRAAQVWRDFAAIVELTAEESALALARDSIRMLLTTAANQQGQIANLQALLAAADIDQELLAQNTALVAANMQLALDTAARGSSNRALQGQVSALTSSNAALQSQNGTLGATITSKNEIIASKDAAIESKDATIAAKDAAIARLEAQLAQCTPSAAAAEVAALLNVYPNPTQNGVLVIKDAELEAGEKVEVYAINGGLVAVYEIIGATTTINIGNLAAGTYIVKVGGKAGKVVKR